MFAHGYFRLLQDGFIAGVQPDDVFHAAEPGQLALCIVAAGLLEFVGTGGKFRSAFKIGKELLVTDGLRRRAVAAAVLKDQLCFFQNARFEHTVHPQVNAAVKLRPVGRSQTEHPRIERGRFGQGFRPLPAHGLAGGVIKLQRAYHPPHIVGMDCGGVVRVHGRKLLVHRFEAEGCRLLLQFFPQSGVCLLLGKAHPVQKAFDVQAGAAHKNGQSAPGGDGLYFPVRGLHKVRHAERLFRRQKIHQVMGHAFHLFFGRLGGAHVQPFIDLHGVGADDLAAEALCQLDRKSGLAAGGGAAYGHHRHFIPIGQTAFPAPFW